MLQRSFALIAVLLALASPAFAQKLTGKDIFRRFSPLVASIKTDKASGTAFTVYENTAFTCYHVLEGSSAAAIVLANGRTLPVSGVIAVDKSKDIALVHVPGLTSAALSQTKEPASSWSLNIGAAQVGDPIYVITTPLGFTPTLTEGIVAGKRKLPGSEVLQLSGGISASGSGSPVLNSSGHVVGMVTSYGASGLLNFAVSAKDLSTLKWGLPLTVACPVDDPPTTPQPVQKPDAGLLANWLELKPLPESAKFLRGFTDCTVTVDSMSTELGKGIKKGDLEAWVADKLSDNGIRVLDSDEQSARANIRRPSDAGELKQQDDSNRCVGITIQAIKDKSGVIFYAVDIDVYRGAFVYPGVYVPARVVNSQVCGFLGTSPDFQRELRSSVEDCVQDVVEMIKAANRK